MDDDSTLARECLDQFKASIARLKQAIADEERLVGPQDATCTTGAWSPDGKWVYVSANKGGEFHIWRQRFPDGPPQELTSGPTEEEGIAMANDGKSFITSVGTRDSTIWLRDSKGDRQLTSEGDTSGTTLSLALPLPHK